MAQTRSKSQGRQPARALAFTAPEEIETAARDDSVVSRRAYELYLARGGGHGHDLEDWFRAEREVAESPRRSGNGV